MIIQYAQQKHNLNNISHPNYSIESEILHVFAWLSHQGLCLRLRGWTKNSTLKGLFDQSRVNGIGGTCPVPYTSLQNSHVQHSAILGQVFMGKERRFNRAGVRIREQSAYKSSETVKPFPSFSLMRPSSKFCPHSQTFPIIRALRCLWPHLDIRKRED